MKRPDQKKTVFSLTFMCVWLPFHVAIIFHLRLHYIHYREFLFTYSSLASCYS